MKMNLDALVEVKQGFTNLTGNVKYGERNLSIVDGLELPPTFTNGSKEERIFQELVNSAYKIAKEGKTLGDDKVRIGFNYQSA